MVTTIQLDEKTKHKLEELKSYSRETYNDVVERLIRSKEEEERLSPTTIKNIESSLDDIKKGRIYSTSQVKKKLGLR
jgi:predicted transcriptional regulator